MSGWHTQNHIKIDLHFLGCHGKYSAKEKVPTSGWYKNRIMNESHSGKSSCFPDENFNNKTKWGGVREVNIMEGGTSFEFVMAFIKRSCWPLCASVCNTFAFRWTIQFQCLHCNHHDRIRWWWLTCLEVQKLLADLKIPALEIRLPTTGIIPLSEKVARDAYFLLLFPTLFLSQI